MVSHDFTIIVEKISSDRCTLKKAAESCSLLSAIMIVYESCCCTSLFTSEPSALPFTFGMIAAITFPISAFDFAPFQKLSA